jgi:hypothetical protein
MAYAGFDRADCPEISFMAKLKAETNLAWCGFYLPAPSQAGTTWKGKRAALVAQGWGLAPVYVGQQVTGPGSHLVTAEQGTLDGAHAAQAMAAEGFPQKSWVYLDLENGPPLPYEQRDYVGAWVDAVEVNGYCAGVYCSFMLAANIASLRPSARIWAFHVRTTSAHVVGGTTFASPDPATSGFAGASIWQLDDEARIMGGLAVDLDSAAMRDPSAPDNPDVVKSVAVTSPGTGYDTRAPIGVVPVASPKPALDLPGPSFPTSSKELVAVIQTYLVQHGAKIQIDGVWGEKTRDAFMQVV